MKQVYIARNPTEAHLVKSLLEAEGIPAMVQGEYLFGIHGEIPITPDTCPSVWVLDESHFGRARELGSAFCSGENPKETTSEAWQCDKCSEFLEGQFNQCWRCGTDCPSES